MFQVARDWNPKQARLKELISDPACFREALALCLELHALTHEGTPSSPTLLDEVRQGLSREAFLTMPTKKDVTIAWNLWHITRIEDIVAGPLIANGAQVLDDEWMERLNARVRDTGNAMSDEEILALSEALDMEALFSYRAAVGQRTREALLRLTPADLKRRPEKESLNRVLREGGVTEQPESLWLLDFWGRKNVAGLILMPLTRHQAGHLNDCMNLKRRLLK